MRSRKKPVETETKQVNVRLPDDLDERLEYFAWHTRTTKQAVVLAAVREYLAKESN